MRHRLLLTLLMCIGVNCLAQSPDDPLPASGVNLKYLEHLVKTGVDSVRIAHNLTPLRNDIWLYKAATLHAAYMDSVNKLTHHEPEFINRFAPSDRVAFCGGTGFSGVGENCLFSFAHQPLKDKHDNIYINDTYGQMARNMVNSWVNSPGHYQNIITPGYEFTGVAVAYNPKTGKYYAAQVFGTRAGYKPYTPAEDSAFDYSTFVPPPVTSSFSQVSHDPHSVKHAWKLKAPKDTLTTCAFCMDGQFTPGRGTTMFVKNGKIYFRTKDTEYMQWLLNNRRDGLAAEIVTYKPVDCGNPQFYEKPSRRNGQCLFNGRVLKPLYKKKLKKGFKKKKNYSFKEKIAYAASSDDSLSLRGKLMVWNKVFSYPYNAEYYEIVLGKLPKNSTGLVETNLVIIQKKQVCAIKHFTSYCGEDWKYTVTSLHPVSFYPDSLKLKSVKARRTFTVPFEQNKYEYAPKDIRPFLDSLSTSAFYIHSAQIEAFASVEGSEAINKQLQQRRSQSIVQAMQTTQRDTFPYTINTGENWALFEKQIQRTPALAIFKGKSHDEVKKMLLDTAIARIAEPWLSKQRFARITLQISVQPTPKPTCEWLNDHYKAWTDSTLKSVFKPYYLDSLSRLQAYEFSLLLLQKADTQCFRKRKFPPQEIFHALRWRQAWMVRHHLYNGTDSLKADRKLFNEAYFIANSHLLTQHWEPVFCAAELYLRYGMQNSPLSGDDPEVFLNLLSWLATHAPDSMQRTLENLIVTWHYQAVPYYEAKGKKFDPNVYFSLLEIEKYWMNGRMNDSIGVKLAKYCIEHDAIYIAYYILDSIATKPEPNHEALILYIKLHYAHFEEADSTYFNEYLELLRWSKSYLTHNEWCEIFVGPCNVSFQLFDHEGARQLYCEECAGYPNYARTPSRWEK
jgi:hypothetical protein